MPERRVTLDKADINTIQAALRFYEDDCGEFPETYDDEHGGLAPIEEVFDEVTAARREERTLRPAAINAMIAALEHYLEKNQGEPDNRDDEIHELATGGAEFEDISYDDDGIEGLITRLKKNVGRALHPILVPETYGQEPEFNEGDFVNVLRPHGLSAYDQEGRKHAVTGDDLMNGQFPVTRAAYLGGECGWQYEIAIPVSPGETDEDGDPLAVIIRVDDTDRGSDDRLPLKWVASPKNTLRRRAGPR